MVYNIFYSNHIQLEGIWVRLIYSLIYQFYYK